MESIGIEKVQLGQTSMFGGIWNNILSGSLEMEIFICENCGKTEFFSDVSQQQTISQIDCPHCNKPHDIDDVKCPHCNRKM